MKLRNFLLKTVYFWWNCKTFHSKQFIFNETVELSILNKWCFDLACKHFDKKNNLG